MSNRAIYAIIAVVALAAIGGFYLMIRGDADAQVTATKDPKPPTGGFAGPGHGPAQVPGRTPSVPAGSDSADLPDKVREYAANGAIIRDHRTGAHGPIEVDPQAAPANTTRKIKTELTKAVADKVRDVMHECVATLPQTARGERPRLEGTINIAIKDKVISVTKSDLAVKDVIGDAAATTRDCIAKKSLTVTQAAGDEQDLPSYDINLSFTLI